MLSRTRGNVWRRSLIDVVAIPEFRNRDGVDLKPYFCPFLSNPRSHLSKNRLNLKIILFLPSRVGIYSNSMNADVIKQVEQIFQEIDRQTATLQAATGLHCPPGCGRCCENPEVETTVLEMMPLALELWQRGEVLQWIDRSQAVEERGPCVFYHPDPFIPGNGRCSVYSWRPTICRLFAFATVTNKQGQPELAACVRQKEIMPEIIQACQRSDR